MRSVVTWVLTLGLAAGTPALAAPHTDKNSPGPSEAATTAAAKPAQPTPGGAEASPAPSPVEVELQQLKDTLERQSQELESQRAVLREQQKKMEALEEQLRAASTAARTPVAASATTAAAPPAAVPQPTPLSQGYSNGGNEEQKSPLSFKIGSAEFTPGGFIDFTSAFRTTNVGSGIGTSFGAIPFNNSLPAAALTESRFSAQNSRLALKVDTKVGETKVMGYVEADFLGFQPPNANVTSNSNSFRMRVYFADLRRGNWEILGGQDWSLMTPNRVGLSPMPGDIFYTQNMDSNYQVGLTWARQAQFRVVYHPNNNWAFGTSLENPQQLAPSSVVFPSASFASQFDNGSGSTSAASSGTNTATPNLHPDVVLKTAFDGHLGDRAMHFEVAGVIRSFKVNNALAVNAFGAPSPQNDSITGGGGSFNMNLELFKNFHLITNTFYSYGGGRYIFGLGPDAIVRPDGRLSGVHSGSGIAGFEWQATPHYMFYGYYGGAYYERNFGFLPATGKNCAGVAGFTCVGFGFPGSSASSNRSIQEGTFGVIDTFWKKPNYGALQIITQYSYLTRSPWSILSVTTTSPATAPKNAHTSLIYVDLRYVLP